jgi:hypothetical protein
MFACASREAYRDIQSYRHFGLGLAAEVRKHFLGNAASITPNSCGIERNRAMKSS